ncbi:MAG: uroporphyrinogen decarboxylase family protein [Rectinemataceae bacterium]
MDSLERTRKTIAGDTVDHLPAQPMLMMFAARNAGFKYIDYTKDPRRMAEAQLKAADDFGMDCLLTCSDPAREVIDIDGEGSVDWFVDQGPAINEGRAALSDKRRLASLKLPDPNAAGRMQERIEAIRIMRKEAGEGMSIVGWVEGPLALAQELRGLNNIMVDFLDDAPFIKDILDFCAEVAIPFALAQIEAGADTIGMSDAAACMIGPDLYRTFVNPIQHRILGAVRAERPETILRLHMCGRTDPLFPMMRLLPVDIYEIDFPASLEDARRVLGSERTIAGNVSTITDLLEGTPEEVYRSCARCHGTCGGHFIVGAGCEVSPLTPPENLRAMLAYAREHDNRN